MNAYGTDKPETRLPPFHIVTDLLGGEGLVAEGTPLVAIHVPKTGTLARRERDEMKAAGQELGLRVFDDIKRLAVEQGFKNMYEHGLDKVKSGLTTVEEISTGTRRGT